MSTLGIKLRSTNRPRERRCWALKEGFSRCERKGPWRLLCVEHSEKRYLLKVGVRFLGVVGSLLTIFGVIYTVWPSPLREYHIAVTTVDEKGAPADARVEVSVKSIINGNGHLWNIEVQSSNLPPDRKITISAENKIDFLQGRREITLGKAPNITVTLVMIRDRSARAFGRVIDKEQTPIEDALVFVIGHENEVAHTGNKGQFDLPANAASGEAIRLRVEKNGYDPEEVVNISGESIQIILFRSRH